MIDTTPHHRVRGWSGIASLGAALLAVAVLSTALLTRPASAADIKLDNFKIVIGDNGDRNDNWDNRPNRVQVRIDGGDRNGQDLYFSDIASASYVLDRQYGNTGYSDFQVAYRGNLINAQDAWYFWDSSRSDRGGTPLILAFDTRSHARSYGRNHRGTVLSYDDLQDRLSSWRNDNSTTIYWRGQDKWDNAGWDTAWSSRWNGYDYDDTSGWSDRRHSGRNRGRTGGHSSHHR